MLGCDRRRYQPSPSLLYPARDTSALSKACGESRVTKPFCCFPNRMASCHSSRKGSFSKKRSTRGGAGGGKPGGGSRGRRARRTGSAFGAACQGARARAECTPSVCSSTVGGSERAGPAELLEVEIMAARHVARMSSRALPIVLRAATPVIGTASRGYLAWRPGLGCPQCCMERQ